MVESAVESMARIIGNSPVSITDPSAMHCEHRTGIPNRGYQLSRASKSFHLGPTPTGITWVALAMFKEVIDIAEKEWHPPPPPPPPTTVVVRNHDRVLAQCRVGLNNLWRELITADPVSNV